jgi:hypothetical protein
MELRCVPGSSKGYSVKLRRKPQGILIKLAALAVVVAWPNISSAQSKIYPPTAVVNVKEQYQAKGDGKIDDSAALQQAIQENVGTNRTLYFPDGTYLISKRLEWRAKDGTWKNGLTLQGQSRNGTVIRLRDNADGFADPLSPRAIIHTASQPGGPYDALNGDGFNAFRNYLFDLTLDTGNANPGAIGIDYIANNNGEIGNVTIRSGEPQGHAGLSLTRHPGPCLIKNVSIEGFDYGVIASSLQYSITFEHLSLSGQRIAGVHNDGNVLTFRDLRSTGAMPVVQNLRAADGNRFGLVTIIDGTFTGTGNALAISAIDDHSHIMVRNLAVTGYASAIRHDDVRLPGPQIAEYTSEPARTLFPAPPHSLNLPVQETPDEFDADPTHWESVAAHGAMPDGDTDDTAAIQSALDAGKSTVFFPTGRYRVSGTLHVRGAVRYVRGFGSNLFPIGPNFDNAAAPRPLLRMEGPGDAEVEGFNMNLQIPIPRHPGLVFVEHATPRTLTLRFLTMYGDVFAAYRGSGAGTLFIEDVSGQANGVGWFLTPGQKVWARQWNPEGNSTMISNIGATVWILGLKSEGTGTVIDTSGGGQTELLGGLLYPASGNPGTTPAFRCTDSNVSLTYATLDYNNPATGYKTQVRQTRVGTPQTLDLGSNRVVIPLFVGTTGK